MAPGSARRAGRAPVLAGVLLAALPVLAGAAPPRVPDTIAARVQACAACHGKEGKATASGYFPRIAGKPEAYLYRQLLAFRDGRRNYPQMRYLLANLSDVYLKEMAAHFAGLALPYPAPEPAPASSAVRERGRVLVMQGDPQRGLPACVACHGTALSGALPAIPGLVGLSRHYLNAQLGAWRSGACKAAAPDCMAEISRKLSPEDIGAITGWLAAQPVPRDAAPLPSTSVPLPLSCGATAP